MVKKLMYISPVGYNTYDNEIENYLLKYAENCTICATSLSKAPYHLEYLYYSALIGPELLNTIKQAEIDGFDAAIIGCFYDPFLYEAREMSDRLVVTAPCEASLSIATKLGASFSIIVGRRKVIPYMKENVRKYGFENRLASFRSVELGVLDFQEKKELAEERILKEAERAVKEDGAEVIILGCTKEFGFFEKIQDCIGVPAIDSMIAACKEAEHLVSCRDKLNWTISKVGAYEPPKIDEIRQWKLDEYFQIPVEKK
ncbi:MAG: aspartate/glutamate racemase family protein [Acetomicrobium sp.]|jgi:allantoin racemase|uniref:aspartate/glutamate racemase family protein n=1 Tax=Acetomicrobium mobile TaxID=97477 RepID=UPI0026EB21D7|nr:aspartate/glutamate racemase family protein [Acetomicrobium mobile]HPT64607.1 aspartate/glutamate racemase family protein [Acetomicrobium sp.]